jgi:hypothetical protein
MAGMNRMEWAAWLEQHGRWTSALQPGWQHIIVQSATANDPTGILPTENSGMQTQHLHEMLL